MRRRHGAPVGAAEHKMATEEEERKKVTFSARPKESFGRGGGERKEERERQLCLRWRGATALVEHRRGKREGGGGGGKATVRTHLVEPEGFPGGAERLLHGERVPSLTAAREHCHVLNQRDGFILAVRFRQQSLELCGVRHRRVRRHLYRACMLVSL